MSVLLNKHLNKIHSLFMHVFGIGCVKKKYSSAYNNVFALFLCVLAIMVYLEKRFLYTGFSIFATCLQFVQYYLVQTHVVVTIMQTTRCHVIYDNILEEVHNITRQFGRGLEVKKFAFFGITVYTTIAISVLFFEDQRVSWSFWVSMYLSTMNSILFINYVTTLLNFCIESMEILNSRLENMVSFSTIPDKILKSLLRFSLEPSLLRNALVVHKSICDLSKNIVKAAALSLSVLVLAASFSYSVLLYKIAMFFISNTQSRRSKWCTLYLMDFQVIVVFGEVWMIVRSCQNLLRSTNRIAIPLHQLKNLYPNFGEHLFNAHSMKLLNKKLSLGLWDIFVLDSSLLYGIVITFGTLVVISLQCDEDFLITNPKTVLTLLARNKTS
ncbi:hypothetical protein FQA39_LY14836 [Lamprigera yunnana]|nr:hypothetical protein FQA39_LY14836 [Lamprigera yunnana]